MLLPEFTGCCCLSENASWAFFLPKTTFLSKTTGIASFPYHENRSSEISSLSSHFNLKIVGDNRSSEQILTETVYWVPLIIRHE